MLIPRSFVRSGWTPRRLAGGLILLALGFAVTAEAWAGLWRLAVADQWVLHLLLVPAAALWVAWVRRERIRQCQPLGTRLGPILVLIGGLLYHWGNQQTGGLAWHGGALLIMVGCVVSVAGRDVLLRFLPAFAVLIFLLPVPAWLQESLTQPIQAGIAHMVWTASWALGFAQTMPGVIPEDQLTVASVERTAAEIGCGLQTVMTLWLLVYTFVFGRPLRAPVRALILILTPVAAILCSAVGLLAALWVFGYLASQHSYLLLISRWLILAVGFLVVVGIMRLLMWASVPVRLYTLACDC